jgi:hypothetical protein
VWTMCAPGDQRKSGDNERKRAELNARCAVSGGPMRREEGDLGHASKSAILRRYNHHGRLSDDPTREHRQRATIVDHGRFRAIRLHATKTP